MAARSDYPYMRTANVLLTVTPGFTEAKAAFDTSQLVNDLRVPIEVKELRFYLDVGPSDNDFISLSPFVYLEGRFGKFHITDGKVPFSVLSPYRYTSEISDIYTIANGATARSSIRRIVLPKPLFLLPGMGFSFVASIPTSAFWTGITTASIAVRVHVAMIGRALAETDAPPAFNLVPMVSHTQLTQAKLVSLEDELQNPLSQVLSVQRLVGAVPFRTSGSNILLNDPGNPNRFTTIALRFPNSNALSESPIDFMRLGFGQMKVLPIRFEMPANTRLRAILSANAAEDGAGANPLVGYQISLFGTRPEAIS